jgi:chromosome segregation ATPase
MNMRNQTPWSVLFLLCGVAVCGHASAEGMEERLRAQLRSTTSQLQALQSEKAQGTAARAAAENEARQAQEQVKQLTAELAKARGIAEQLAGEQQSVRSQAQAQMSAQAAASQEQVGKFKQAYDELLGMARAKETERARLQAQLTERDTQVQQCAVKNQQMYDVAKSILADYEKIDVAQVMKIRQPFASGARVKFEEMTQQLGDDLYKTHFDAAQVTPAAQ